MPAGSFQGPGGGEMSGEREREGLEGPERDLPDFIHDIDDAHVLYVLKR